MKHIIDIETWERRDNYNFFRNFHNSWISITSEELETYFLNLTGGADHA